MIYENVYEIILCAWRIRKYYRLLRCLRLTALKSSTKRNVTRFVHTFTI